MARYSISPPRVAALPMQLPRDRRRRTTQTAGDLTDTAHTSMKDRDLLPLRERQVTPRDWDQADRGHAGTLAEPSRADRLRHASLRGGVLAGAPASNCRPESLPVLPSRHRRPAWRSHRRPPRSIGLAPLAFSTRNQDRT